MSNFYSPLEVLKGIADGASLLKGKSPTDFAKACRVEPLVLVDERIMHYQQLSLVMGATLDLFTGYYAQAANTILNVKSVEIMSKLEQLNPNRDAADAFIGMGMDYLEKSVSTEGLHLAAVQTHTMALPFANQKIGMEAFDPVSISMEDGKYANGNVVISTKELQESVALGVGKMIGLTVTDAKNVQHNVYINVRLVPAPTSAATIVDILSLGSEDNSLNQRIKLWRANQIEFFSDLVLCQDLIDKHRQSLLNDKGGSYRAIMERKRNSTLAAIATRKVSLGAASNIMVVSEQSVKDFQRRLGVSLGDFKARERIFEEVYVMLLVVVDPEWDAVTIYHRGLKEASSFRVSDLKTAGKGGNQDLTEIFKALLQGNAPSI
jgi:hypothetical protein